MLQGWHGSPLRYQFSPQSPIHEPRGNPANPMPLPQLPKREPQGDPSHQPSNPTLPLAEATWGVKDQADQFLPQLTHITPVHCAQRGLPVRQLAAPSPDRQAALWDFQIQTDKIVMAYHHGGLQTTERGSNDRCSNPKRC